MQLKDIGQFASILGEDAEGVRDITQLLALAQGYGIGFAYFILFSFIILFMNI